MVPRSLGLSTLLTGLLLLSVSGSGHAQPGAWYILHERFANLHPITVYAERLKSGYLFISEDPNNPRLRAFRQHEQLDRLIHPGMTELERLTELDHWALRQFPNGSPFPHYPPWDAELILDAIRQKKTGGFCAQYALVFGQACQSFGYTVRYVDLATQDLRATHFIPEVYVPSAKKWVAFWLLQESYYEDAAGNPLSVLELHQALLGRLGSAVYQMPQHQRIPPKDLALFYHFRYYLRNNFLTVPVFVRYVERSNGTQMFFETYRLRWIDDFTRAVPESGSSYTSSNPADFDYALDLAHPAGVKTGWIEFFDFAEAGKRLQVYRLEMTRGTLQNFIRQRIKTGDEYHPLSWIDPEQTQMELADNH